MDNAEAFARNRFSEIYSSGAWGRGSGVGSLADNNIEYLGFLRRFMMNNAISSVVDLGCGDWQFSRFINWEGINYTGIDIVSSVVDSNQNEFGSENIKFQTFSSIEKLPSADLIICKDVLQHLPNYLISKYLDGIYSKCKFGLITNDEYPSNKQNHDIESGDWRSLRLDKEPFNLKGATVLSWPVYWGRDSTVKSMFLMYGALLK